MVRFSIGKSEESEEQQDTTKNPETPENNETKDDDAINNETKDETSKNERKDEEPKNDATKRETSKGDTTKKATTKKDSKRVEHLAESFSKLKVGSRLKDTEGYSELKSIARRVAHMEGDVRECRIKLVEMDSRVARMEDFLHKSLDSMMRKLDAVQNRSYLPQQTPAFWWNPQHPFRPVSSTMQEAAERGDCEALLRFLAVGEADVQERNARGDTALHLAAIGGHAKAMRLLLAAGAVADAPGHRLRSPLHCTAANGHVECAERLLAAGALAEAADADGATPLALAALGGHHQIVALLLSRGAHPDAVDLQGLAPIFRAATGGHAHVVRLLLDRGVSADVCDEGDSLIVHAARACQWKVVKLLLEKGVTVAKYSTPDECPLALSAKDGQGDVVRELLRRGAATDELQVESALNVARDACVVWALAEAAPKVVRGEPGKWGLLFAAEDGRLETLVALLEAGVDIQARDESGITALHSAAWNGHFACVRELLQRGADVKWKDGNGDTALHKAALGDKQLCVRALLEAGASVEALNNQGETPKDVAASEVIRRILDGGINAFDYSLNNPGRKRNSNVELFGNEKPGSVCGSSTTFGCFGDSGRGGGNLFGSVSKTNSNLLGSQSQYTSASSFSLGCPPTGPGNIFGVVNQPHGNGTNATPSLVGNISQGKNVFGMGDQPANTERNGSPFYGCTSNNFGIVNQSQSNNVTNTVPFGSAAGSTSQGGHGFGMGNQQSNTGRSGTVFGSASNTFGVTNQSQGKGTNAVSFGSSVRSTPQVFGMRNQESNNEANGFSFGCGAGNGPRASNTFGMNNQPQSNAPNDFSFGVGMGNPPRPSNTFGVQSAINATNNVLFAPEYGNTTAKRNVEGVNESESNMTKPFTYKVSGAPQSKKVSGVDTQPINNDQKSSSFGSNAANIPKDNNTLGTSKESSGAATFGGAVSNASSEKTVVETSNQSSSTGSTSSILGSHADPPKENAVSSKINSSSTDEKNDTKNAKLDSGKEEPKEILRNLVFKPFISSLSNKSNDI